MELLKANIDRNNRKLQKHRRRCHRVKTFRIFSLTTLVIFSLKGSISILTSQFNFAKNFSLTNLLICSLPVCFLCYCVYKVMKEFKII